MCSAGLAFFGAGPSQPCLQVAPFSGAWLRVALCCSGQAPDNRCPPQACCLWLISRCMVRRMGWRVVIVTMATACSVVLLQAEHHVTVYRPAACGSSLHASCCAEWGDRSQIATVTMAADQNPYGVTLGALTGHSICTGAAVMGGGRPSWHLQGCMRVIRKQCLPVVHGRAECKAVCACTGACKGGWLHASSVSAGRKGIQSGLHVQGSLWPCGYLSGLWPCVEGCCSCSLLPTTRSDSITTWGITQATIQAMS